MKILASLSAAILLLSFAFAAPPAGAPAPTPAAASISPPPLTGDLKPANAIGECIYTRADMSPEAFAKSPIMLLLTVKSTNPAATSATVSLSAEDMFSKPVVINGATQFSVPLQKGEGAKNIPFQAPGPGYFLLHAEIHAGADTATVSGDFGIVPPPHAGVRPDSLFSCTASPQNSEEKMDLWQAVGMKKARTCMPTPLKNAEGLAPGQVPPIDWTNAEQMFATLKAHSIWPFVESNYTLGPGDEASAKAKATGMYGPPADELRYAKFYGLLFQHFPEITMTEFLNEPWLYGYGFAGSNKDYQDFQRLFCQEVLKLRPDMRIVAGNSDSFVIDSILPDPSCWKGLLSGLSHHPYTKDDADPSWRLGANVRAYDAIGVLARRMGLPYACLTEAGTMYGEPSPTASAEVKAQPAVAQYKTNGQQASALKKKLNAEKAATKSAGTTPAKKNDQDAVMKTEVKTLEKENLNLRMTLSNNIENAAKIVQMNARAAIEGLYQASGGAPRTQAPRDDTAFAVETHFLEDRVPLADIWPSNELIWGGVFANPKFITPEIKALPRANELSTRWKVAIPKEYQDDKLKVAVIWSLTGQSNDKLDTNGTLTIPNAEGLTAYDMTGRVIPASPDGLTVPFCNNPVYITSDTLSVIDLLHRVAKGIIKNVTPVNLYAFSLMDDPTQPQKLTVRVENQLNETVKGTLHLKVAGVSEETSAPFSIEASKLAEVAVPWPSGVSANANNQYAITLTTDVTSTAPSTQPMTVSRQQITSWAEFAKKTIAFTGSANDWKGLTPVVVDSSLLHQKIDMSEYVLQREVDKPPTDDTTAPKTVAHVYTAYDQKYVYLGASFNEDSFANKAGQPIIKGKGTKGHHIAVGAYVGKTLTLPGKMGFDEQGGSSAETGDCFEFAFGFRDRVPGWGRQMGDPYEWKGNFFDVDYLYNASPSTEGDMLCRLWGPNTSRTDDAVSGQVIALDPPYKREAPAEEAGAPPPTPLTAKELSGVIAGAKVQITRDDDGNMTFYEVAVPRTEIKMFDPAKGKCRFSFMIFPTNKKTGKPMNWGDFAGVFDHWASFGSFPPLYASRTPCQTFFGIEK